MIVAVLGPRRLCGQACKGRVKVSETVQRVVVHLGCRARKGVVVVRAGGAGSLLGAGWVGAPFDQDLAWSSAPPGAGREATAESVCMCLQWDLGGFDWVGGR